MEKVVGMMADEPFYQNMHLSKDGTIQLDGDQEKKKVFLDTDRLGQLSLV